jgi:hypothetical protein
MKDRKWKKQEISKVEVRIREKSDKRVLGGGSWMLPAG